MKLLHKILISYALMGCIIFSKLTYADPGSVLAVEIERLREPASYHQNFINTKGAGTLTAVPLETDFSRMINEEIKNGSLDSGRQSRSQQNQSVDPEGKSSGSFQRPRLISPGN